MVGRLRLLDMAWQGAQALAALRVWQGKSAARFVHAQRAPPPPAVDLNELLWTPPPPLPPLDAAGGAVTAAAATSALPSHLRSSLSPFADVAAATAALPPSIDVATPSAAPASSSLPPHLLYGLSSALSPEERRRRFLRLRGSLRAFLGRWRREARHRRAVTVAAAAQAERRTKATFARWSVAAMLRASRQLRVKVWQSAAVMSALERWREVVDARRGGDALNLRADQRLVSAAWRAWQPQASEEWRRSLLQPEPREGLISTVDAGSMCGEDVQQVDEVGSGTGGGSPPPGGGRRC